VGSDNPISPDNAASGLSQEVLDVLVVGGGIIGAGVCRDAAMRGLRVGLIEQHDLAFGTSSRSARLLHGGLRYLAQGRVRLVRQASLEKLVVQRIAPHLAMPLPFIFPTYRGTPWPKWKLRLGVKMYDLLCHHRNFGHSSTLSREQVKSLLPGVNTQRLTGAVRYYDGATNDARLVIDTHRSAARHGAIVSNYMRLEDSVHDGGVWRSQLSDTLTDQSYEVRSRCVVNATGPWSNRLPNSQISIRGTKGVHLIVSRQRLAIPEAVMMTEQKRIVWAVPWADVVYIGTTDTDYSGDPEDVCTSPQDVQYILEVTNTYFPAVHLTESDLIQTWAGVCPLIANPRGGPSDVSRSYQIKIAPQGWIDVAGGKLTTYRLIAQQTVNHVGRCLGRRLPDCRTADAPLLEPGDADGVSSVIPPPVTEHAVNHYCRNEWAIHLDDVMVRRTRWHHYHIDADVIAQQVASWMAGCLGWSETRQQEELQRYRRVLN
jgi:glycerol-3-phosphate dehydrogenase